MKTANVTSQSVSRLSILKAIAPLRELSGPAMQHIRIAFVLLLVLVCIAPTILAAEPTVAELKSLKEKFDGERQEALAAKFPGQAFERADELARRALEQQTRGDLKSALRHLRDARWQLPYLPAGLPPHVVRVFGESRLRHSGRINSLAYSPDGTRLASSSADGTAKIWDLGNGREITTYRGHIDQPDDPTRPNTNRLKVSAIAFHPTKKTIASVSGNQVHLWDPETGKYIKTLFHLKTSDKPLRPIAFSPDGKHLAIGGDDGIFRIVELETGKVEFECAPRNARIESLAYSPKGDMIVVGDSNSQVAVYAPKQTNPLLMSVLGVDLGEVRDVAFTADGSAILSCGLDPKVRLTAGPKADGTATATTATRLREFSGHSGRVNALALLPDGSQLVTGGSDYTVRVWDVTSAKQLRVFQGHQSRRPGGPTTDYGVTAVAVRPDGKQIASGSDDGAMRLWDLNQVDDSKTLSDATESLWNVAYSPDGKYLAAAGGDKLVRVYNADTYKLQSTLKAAQSPITSLAWFPDSKRLASAGGDQVIRVWDALDAKLISTLKGHESAILSLAISDDGKRIVSGAADRTVRGFSPEVKEPLWTWTGRTAVCAVAIQKGNKIVAAGLADGTLVLLDVSGATPRELHTQATHIAGISCIAFNSAGDRLASVGGDGALRVWTVEPGGSLAQLARFEGQAKSLSSSGASPLTGVAFSPDGRFVATVGAEMTIRLWDVETKTEARSLRGHTDWVTSVAFSPNGRYLASVGVEKDGVVRIFELPALETSSSGGHILAVNAVAVNPDGKTVATAGTDQTIKLWNIVSGKEMGTLVGNADIPYSIAFMGDNKLVMGGSTPSLDGGGRLHFWQTKPAQLLKSVGTGEVDNVAASADGKKVIAWVRRPAQGDKDKHNFYEVYDDAGSLLDTIHDKGKVVRAVTFSPDLEWTIVGDDKGNVVFWDMKGKKTIGDEWPLSPNPFVDIGITADKKYLVAADEKGELRIADIAKRHVVATLNPHSGGIRAIAVSPTGSTFITMNNDRELKAWSFNSLKDKEPKAIRTWTLPVTVNGLAYTPDGKQLVTGNADGTAYLLQLP